MTGALEAEIQAATAMLKASCEQPRDEAQWLLAEMLGVSRATLRSFEQALAEDDLDCYHAYVRRRAEGEPLAYIVGNQPFRRLSLKVDPAVLIPRPDTEHLVTWALEVLAAMGRPCRVLDACTGSGCVALALADETRGHDITASDCSPAALAVARANALKLHLPVAFVEADALALPAGTPAFHLITANPPYIAEGDSHLPALLHEPALALVSGPDGLDLLRRVIDSAPDCLAPDGWLLLEHGYDQAERVRALLRARGFAAVETRRDYGGNDRISGGRWPLAHG